MLTRRNMLTGAAASGALLAAPRRALALPVIDLELLDPFSSPTAHYDQIRALFNEVADVEAIAKQLWDRFTKTREFRFGHWALNYTYLWWQATSTPDERIRAARIGQKMAAAVDDAGQKSAAGPFWGAAFFGFEALSRGILNSLQMIPQFYGRLDEAEKRDPTYLNGSVYMARAKSYIKLPPFPMSLGSLDKGAEYLEQARPHQEFRYALWYVVRAEYDVQKRGADAAIVGLAEIDKVCPVDLQTRYTFELSKYLAGRFRAAVETGSYDKYTWDPLLEPVLELRDHVYIPKKFCAP